MLKKPLQILSLVIIFSSFLFCKTKKINDDMDNKDKITFTNKEKTTQVYSQNKSKVLVLNYVLSKNPVITYNYKVIDAKTKEELISGAFSGIKMEWNDNESIKGYKYVGMAEGHGDEILTRGKKIQNKNITVIQIK